jgi:outer membrane receptor protein involved in Fe transport
MRNALFYLFFFLMLMGLGVQILWAGTSGKIAGVVTDPETGEALPGANIVVEGTSLGAASDLEGRYTIINVPPGVYNVVASFVGYTSTKVELVRVRIDQTTEVNFELKMQAIEVGSIVVVAEKEVIKKDVATSVTNVSSEEIEALPVLNTRDVINLQAGIQADNVRGIQIRGGGGDQSLFLVDGVTFRDPRNNDPISGISLSSISEISVERGGFAAEYGQVRSGIINIVTKEGSKKDYFGSVTLKASPPHQKFFGISPFDPNSMWLRPYLDDAVCWTGTANGAWNDAMQKQYPVFEGWNSISQKLLADDDPSNDLTPIGAQREYIWQLRKMPVTDQPDYNIDAGFGGPVPILHKYLGDLRYFASYRKEREMYIVPLSRDDYVDYDWTFKLTSNISKSMKLNATFATGKQYTIADNWAGSDFVGLNYLRDGAAIVNTFEDRDYRLFSTGYFSIADISHDIYSLKLTHTLNPSTYYEASLEGVGTKYFTRPPAPRNLSHVYEIVPGYFVDEALYGYVRQTHYARARDNSDISSTTLKFNLTSQLNFNHLVKTGFEFMYNDLDINFGYVSSFSGIDEDFDMMRMHVFPYRGAFYVQDKMEFKELIINLGLRLDYTNSNTDWVNVSAFDESYLSSKYDVSKNYPKKESTGEWSLSPRVGISHPVTENSKLFFNYGHFKQLPIYQELFRISRDVTGAMRHYSDPNLVLSKTIAYELGYDHALFSSYLIQLAGFYRDITDQRSATLYIGRSGVNYQQVTNNNYADFRGFEFTLRKNTGRWLTGFLNYTYQVSKAGNFGYQQEYENPFDNKQYQERATDVYQQRPVPQPYATANINFTIPDDFSKLAVLGVAPLKNVNISCVGNWQAGPWFTYNPKQIQGLINNVQKVDYYDIILRANKKFTYKKLEFNLFVEVDNLLNSKFLNVGQFIGTTGNPQFGPFWDFHDYQAYMESLHLPKSDAYDNIVGKDKIGDYRKEGVDFQPIEFYNEQLAAGDEGVIYYNRNTDKYLEYVGESWQEVSSTRMQKILDEKAYIDMPNMTSFHFLNPRSVFLGLRISF